MIPPKKWHPRLEEAQNANCGLLKYRFQAPLPDSMNESPEGKKFHQHIGSRIIFSWLSEPNKFSILAGLDFLIGFEAPDNELRTSMAVAPGLTFIGTVRAFYTYFTFCPVAYQYGNHLERTPRQNLRR
ncbi:hypothetical protein Mapa_013697 [Marchantia paleacea]|nr:hypothetical protein Mapa_013697 [Marchantia paleacea]